MDRELATSAAGASSFVTPGALPPLEAGDALDQPTFHARYGRMPSSFRAELVEGMVIVPSPVLSTHASCHALVNGWLFVYQLKTPGIQCFDNATVILSAESEVQPDCSVVLPLVCGGRCQNNEGYLTGPPELAVEVASSSEAYDLHAKYRVYESAGLPEYLVVLLREKRVLHFVLSDGRYAELPADEKGVLRSQRLAGLWLDGPALLTGNAGRLIATLEQGLASPEHARQVALWQALLAGGGGAESKA